MQVTGADFNVSARGNNQLLANKLLVLGGWTVNLCGCAGSSFTGRLIPVTLPEIKRIEVLIGPASAIYGFNAFDGVINIITKSPAGDERDHLAIWRRGIRNHHQRGYSCRHHRQVRLSVCPSAMIKTSNGGIVTRSLFAHTNSTSRPSTRLSSDSKLSVSGVSWMRTGSMVRYSRARDLKLQSTPALGVCARGL